MRLPRLRTAFLAVFLCVAACDCKDPEGTGDGGPDAPNPNCGNSEVNTGETCDDGNNMSNDGCSSACLVENGYTCPTPGQACVGCGDDIVQEGEQCDDGANLPDDGCSATCQREPGWDCIGEECTPSACGDGFRVGPEACDDGNRASGDGCSIRCDIEPDYYCPTPGSPCLLADCGDSSINAQEQCDDGNEVSSDGCSASCQLESTHYCPVPGQPCVMIDCGDGIKQGLEQCDDGNEASSDGCSATCQIEDGSHCPTPGQPCVPATCGNGVREGLEECDDGDTATGDGCDGDCDVEAFYECEGSPQSVCEKPIEFVRIARFEAPMQQPQAVHYDPRTRSFVAYDFDATPGIDGGDAQEFCLDGEQTDRRQAALEARRDLVGGTGAHGALDGAAYDPFRDTFLFVQQSGRLTEIERNDTTTMQVTTVDLAAIGDQAMYDNERAGGIQVGDDGRIYVANHYERLVPNGAKGSIGAFRRASNGTIVNMRLAPFAPRTLTGMNPPTYLDNIFNIPGVQWIGYYNRPQPPLTNPQEQAFMFHRYDGTFIGSSTIPGILFRNGEPFPHNADGGEAAVDGGYFLVCSEYLEEDGYDDGICQLFAQTCNTTADCVERVPGTICKLDEPIPYCYAPAVARNDRYTVAAMSGLATFDVMMNDSFADSVCSLDTPTITSVTQGDHGGTVAINGGMDRVQYTPMGACGYMETFTYTADLGGGAMDSATVTVTVPCNCGNNVIDAGEECDGTAVPVGRTCTPQCRIAGICGNMVVEAGEECDDGNTVPGDLCSPICTNEIIID